MGAHMVLPWVHQRYRVGLVLLVLEFLRASEVDLGTGESNALLIST